MTDQGSAIKKTLDELLAQKLVLFLRFGAGAPLLDLCRAAARGGLKVLEITLTSPGALEAIETLSKEEGLLVGAGTVMTPEEARAVAAAGGRFALSPVCTPSMMDEADDLGLLSIPGASTPNEIEAAHRHGAPVVKVFPSGALGGPDYIRAIRGPLPHIKLMPTSGPTTETLADYFAAGAAACGVAKDIFTPGCTPASVEAAAAKMVGALRQCS